MPKALRAVGYARTSSEQQRDNASIAGQKDAIERFAAASGWRLVGWYVDESKSGSRIEGRDQFQRMMRDAANGQFDAVIVYDVTRFGRDGADIINSAKTLQTVFGIRVTDTRGGFDSQGSVISNYVHAGMAEEEKRNFLRRTKNAKIEFARKHNAPVMNKRPYGRVWVKGERKSSDGVWAIDPDKQAKIADVANRYLAGESLPRLATEAGISHSQLCKILRGGCGPVWVQHVRCAELGMDETIETTVPPLLDADTIKKVRERLTINRRHGHKPPRVVNDYLLGGKVFCDRCGYTLIGQVNHHGKAYYRHPYNVHRVKKCPYNWGFGVPAKRLEEQVLTELFKLYGNPAALARAVRAAVPDLDEMTKRRDRLNKDLAKLDSQRNRVVDAIADGLFTKTQASAKLAAISEQEGAVRTELEKIAGVLGSVPDVSRLHVYSHRDGDSIVAYGDDGLPAPGGNSLGDWIDLMTSDTDPKELVHRAFGGLLADGSPSGVYVTPPVKGEGSYRNKQYGYVLKGRLDYELVVAGGPGKGSVPPGSCSPATVARWRSPTRTALLTSPRPTPGPGRRWPWWR